MLRSSVSLVAVALVFVAGGAAADAQHLKLTTPADEIAKELDSRVPRLMERARVPGLSVAVVRDGKIILTKAYGDRTLYAAEPVTERTVFEAASIGKPVAAYAALKLRDEGKLALDTPLSTYVKQPYLKRSERADRVTLRRVLTHTSGLGNDLARKDTTLHFEPGARFSYSGVGFDYMQRAIESVTNENFAAFMESAVFDPLAMKSSTYDRVSVGDSASGYMPVWIAQIPLPRTLSMLRPTAASTLSSTPTDLARFMIELMEPKHIAKRTVDEMLTPAIELRHELAWGLGIGLAETPNGRAFWHWGANLGFKSLMIGYPKHKIGVVVMTNGDDGLRIVADVAQIAIGGENRRLWVQVPARP